MKKFKKQFIFFLLFIFPLTKFQQLRKKIPLYSLSISFSNVVYIFFLDFWAHIDGEKQKTSDFSHFVFVFYCHGADTQAKSLASFTS